MKCLSPARLAGQLWDCTRCGRGQADLKVRLYDPLPTQQADLKVRLYDPLPTQQADLKVRLYDLLPT